MPGICLQWSRWAPWSQTRTCGPGHCFFSLGHSLTLYSVVKVDQMLLRALDSCLWHPPRAQWQSSGSRRQPNRWIVPMGQKGISIIGWHEIRQLDRFWHAYLGWFKLFIDGSPTKIHFSKALQILRVSLVSL